MKKGKKLYEGKAKIIYATNDKNLVIQHFKDDATAFNNQKKDVIEGKGILNNRISEHILTQLSNVGIKNHLVKRLNMREQLVKLVEIIPIEFIVRNIATGSLTKRLGIEDGTVLDYPLVEYCLKNDELGDPLVSREHILAFKWMDVFELDFIYEEVRRINDFLQGMFRGVGIKLVDFKVEFGRSEADGKREVMLADEISPDTCRLWDMRTDKKLDSSDEKSAFTLLHRLVFNFKRILSKIPLVRTQIGTYATALFLLREHYGIRLDEPQITKHLMENNMINYQDSISEEVVGFGNMLPAGEYTLKDMVTAVSLTPPRTSTSVSSIDASQYPLF